MYLCLRTDKPEAELYLYENTVQVDSLIWQAHRELSITLLQKIEELLTCNQRTLQDISGLLVYQGPGSFTGLRIGITVANTMAYSLDVPIVGAEGEDWQQKGLHELSQQRGPQVVMPLYGAEAHITKPRK